MVAQIFSKFCGGLVRQGGETVSVKLQDDRGTSLELELSPDILELMAHELLALCARAFEAQKQGISTPEKSGERFVAKALLVDTARPSWTDDGRSVVLDFRARSGARYQLAMTPESLDQLCTAARRDRP